MHAMLAPKNVNATMLTTASNAHKYVVAVQKNVEGWQGELGNPIPIFSLGLWRVFFSITLTTLIHENCK
jgi:hypothetical protein